MHACFYLLGTSYWIILWWVMKQQKRKVLQVVRLKVRLKSVGGWMMMKRFLINNQKVPPSSYSEFQLFSFLFPGKLIQGQIQLNKLLDINTQQYWTEISQHTWGTSALLFLYCIHCFVFLIEFFSVNLNSHILLLWISLTLLKSIEYHDDGNCEK